MKEHIEYQMYDRGQGWDDNEMFAFILDFAVEHGIKSHVRVSISPDWELVILSNTDCLKSRETVETLLMGWIVEKKDQDEKEKLGSYLEQFYKGNVYPSFVE